MLAMNLETYLQTKKLRAVHFAEEIGVSPSTVTRWLRGETYPKPDQLRLVYSKTGGKVTANDFLLDT